MSVDLVVTDLDGTLLDSRQRLSESDRQTLEVLGAAGTLRVVATGRSLFSARQVLGRDIPIDYLVYSSGAGIVSWPDQRPVRAQHMLASDAALVVSELLSRQVDFMLHCAVPDSHRCLVHRVSAENADFERRLARVAAHAVPFAVPWAAAEAMCQALVILPPGAPPLQADLARALPSCRVIRTTSPIDGASMWLEIFPKEVGKGAAAAWLRAEAASALAPRAAGRSVAVGNDYNDLDLLDWAELAFVVGNAPKDLRQRYATVATNDASGFSEAVARALRAASGGHPSSGSGGSHASGGGAGRTLISS